MLALRAARLFDGRTVVERPVVLIDGTQVAAVGVEPAASTDVVDLDAAGGVTLLPGFVDCHQHLCFDGQGTLEEQVIGIEGLALVERARAAARRALAGGVTTVRDLGDRDGLTLALRGEADLPTIVAAGPPITRPDGHCWYLGGGCAVGVDAARAAARSRLDGGVDVVKVMVTGGALTTGRYAMWSSQFGLDELRAIVETSHAGGRPVAAHCHGVEGIAMAVEAGVDSLEHCSFFTAEGRVEAPSELVARIAESGIPVSATVGTVPDWVPTPLVRQHRAAIERTRALLVAAGVTMVVGTDAGIHAGKPHDVMPFAFADLRRAGMSALEALRAMTADAAGVCGRADRAGRLAPGFEADLVAVAGDPALDPAAVTRIVAVWKGGRRVR